MKVGTIVLAPLAVALCGCEPVRKSPAVAFKAADAIVVTNDATPKTNQGKSWYKLALADLTNALTRVTGAPVAVYAEGQEPPDAKAVIYLGETAAAKAAGVADANLRNGDWRVKTAPGKAFLFGKTGMAASYAMTEFVETFLGYRFFSPYADASFTPNPACAIPLADIVRTPVIYQRDIYVGLDGRKHPTRKAQWDQYIRRRRSNWTDELEGEYRLCYGPGPCHTIHNYLPPEKHFKDHPEWYSMGRDGKRRGVRNSMSQICYSNPEAREAVYRALVEFVEKEYKRRPDNPSLVFDMTQMDNCDFLCLCPECKKVIAKYNRVRDGHREGGDAGLQLEFVNDLARRIRAKYPKVQLRVFAYVSGQQSPKPGTIVPEPNVIVWWCDLYGVSCHLYPLEKAGHFNEHQAEEVGDWLKLTKNMQVWDYALYHDQDVMIDAIAADAKFFSAKGLPIMFMETEYSEQPFYFLHYYLMSELYADPTKDADALFRQFCRGTYGKGAAEMEEAIRYIRDAQNATPVADTSDWHLRRLKWLTPAFYERVAALCEAAYAKDADPNVRAHILMPLKCVWNNLVGQYKKDPKAADKFAAAQEKYRRFGKEWAKDGFVEPKDRDKRAAEVDDEIDVLTLRFDDVPAEVKGTPAKDLVCLDYHTFHSWCRNFTDEKAFRQHAMCVAPDRNACKKGFPFGGGVYDHTSKEYYPYTITAKDLPADGKYHWVKNGRMYIGRNTILWLGEWDVHLPLSANHIYADGLPVDPNWYEMWTSFRVDGPAFVPGSSEQNTIRLDRLLFRRVAPPTE